MNPDYWESHDRKGYIDSYSVVYLRVGKTTFAIYKAWNEASIPGLQVFIDTGTDIKPVGFIAENGQIYRGGNQ